MHQQGWQHRDETWGSDNPPYFLIMAKANSKFSPDLLSRSTMIEVVKTDKNGKSWKKEMSFGEWLAMKKQHGFVYRAFQIGFSKFKIEN